jgi:DNA topoisomerase II
LEEAFHAGDSSRCILVITQDPSIKTILMRHFEIFSLYYVGMLSLTSKPPNARELTPKKIIEYNDFQTIIKALGLTVGKIYSSVTELRYSKVLLVTNQDEQGKETLGLLLNFFHTCWPCLCQKINFLNCLCFPKAICLSDTGRIVYFLRTEKLKQW